MSEQLKKLDTAIFAVERSSILHRGDAAMHAVKLAAEIIKAQARDIEVLAARVGIVEARQEECLND